MHLNSVFITGACIVLSTTTLATNTGETFSIRQVAAGEKLPGPVALKQTYEKYGMIVPPELTEAVSNPSIDVAASNPPPYQVRYLTPVTVGKHAGQSLNLNLDTGSSDLWVFSSLQSKASQQNHTVYKPQSGVLQQGETFNISYHGGTSAAGVVYADNVVIGTATATSQAVEAATSVSGPIVQDAENDGYLGLAFPSLNNCTPNKCKTFFETINSSLAEQVFTIDLHQNEPGTYTFGYVNSSAYYGQINNVSIDNTSPAYFGRWGFFTNGWSRGDAGPEGSGHRTYETIGPSIIDSGSPFIITRTSLVEKFMRSVPGAMHSKTYGGTVFPCASTQQVPSFNVEISGHLYVVPGPLLNYGPVGDGTTCFSALQPSFNNYRINGVGTSIFGVPFLQSVYAIFYPGVPRLGLARQTGRHYI